MSYLAIARKYRPATFEEIVGQGHVTRTLTNAILHDRVHHAYLFTGARGVGKTTAARALARALNCAQGPTPTPCGTCPSCVEVGIGSSPDLIEIDGASNNSVDDVREIRDAVQYAPTRGKKKIYLIDEVHMLSKGAFNALLKTLEEPPPHIVFIFATTEPNKIPETILSRVQRFDFRRIPATDVVERLAEIALAEGVQISEVGLRMIARAGEGSMRDAQSLLDQVIAHGSSPVTDEEIQETLGLIDPEQIHRFLRALISGEPAPCFEVIDHLYGYGHELTVFTAELLELLRHATFLLLSPTSRQYIDLAADELDRLQEVTQGADPEHLTRLFAALLEVHEQVSRAARPRIVLEMSVARLATTRRLQPLTALLERVEKLERQLRAGAPHERPPRTDGPTPRPGPPSAPAAPRRSGPRSGSGSSREPSPVSGSPSATAATTPTITASATPPKQTSQGADAWDALPEATSVSLQDVSLEAVTPKDPTPTTWERLCRDLRNAGEAFAALTAGEAFDDGRTLRIRLRPGRALIESQRVSKEPAVAQAIAAHYPGRSLIIESTGPVAHGKTDLEREFLADPQLTRVMHTLGAVLEHVEPHPPNPEKTSS